MVLAIGLTCLSACTLLPEDEPARPGTGFQIEMQEIQRPDILSREGPAARSSSQSGGMWGVVSGLRTSEQVLVENTENGKTVSIPLYSGPTGGGGIILRLSRSAADELGIEDDPVPIRMTAVRIEPQLIQP